MINFIKEVFSAENFKRLKVYLAMSNQNIRPNELIFLNGVIKELDEQDANNVSNKSKNNSVNQSINNIFIKKLPLSH